MDVVRFCSNEAISVVGKICDRCGLRASAAEDFWEFQEFVRIQIDVGYGTKVFDDGDLLRSDLCQTCAKTLLGPYLRVIATFDDRIRALRAPCPPAGYESGG